MAGRNLDTNELMPRLRDPQRAQVTAGRNCNPGFARAIVDGWFDRLVRRIGTTGFALIALASAPIFALLFSQLHLGPVSIDRWLYYAWHRLRPAVTPVRLDLLCFEATLELCYSFIFSCSFSQDGAFRPWSDSYLPWFILFVYDFAILLRG
jgi:hypothetical protein